jgi:hypothetical protein
MVGRDAIPISDRETSRGPSAELVVIVVIAAGLWLQTCKSRK